MKKNSHITAFYLETLLLIVVFITIILVLTQVFGMAQVQSTGAKELTDAVILAGNTAEAVAASKTTEELLEILNQNQNAKLLENADGVAARYGRDRNPDPEGNYQVEATWIPEETETGMLIHSFIQVRYGDNRTPVYELETEVFLQEMTA